MVSGLYFHAAYFATFSSRRAAKKYALRSVLLWLQGESPLRVSSFSSYKRPFCLITLYDVFIWRQKKIQKTVKHEL